MPGAGGDSSPSGTLHEGAGGRVALDFRGALA